MKKILFGILLAFVLCGCDIVFAQQDDWAIKAILGEGVFDDSETKDSPGSGLIGK